MSTPHLTGERALALLRPLTSYVSELDGHFKLDTHWMDADGMARLGRALLLVAESQDPKRIRVTCVTCSATVTPR